MLCKRIIQHDDAFVHYFGNILHGIAVNADFDQIASAVQRIDVLDLVVIHEYVVEHLKAAEDIHIRQ